MIILKKIFFLSLVTVQLAFAQSYTNNDISIKEIQKHVKFLASDELEGRRSGEKGNTLASQYIGIEFGSYGLKPMGEKDNFFQYFNVLNTVKAGTHNRLTISIGSKILQLGLDQNFRPMVMSSDTFVSSSVVFAGYGIVADSLKYDDYAGLDVQGKIVIALRFTPDFGRNDSKFMSYESPYLKAITARNKGAIGIILVTGPNDEENPGLVALRFDRQVSSAGIPAINVKSTIIDSLFRLSGQKLSLKGIQDKIYETKQPLSFQISHCTISMRTELIRTYAATANVLGFLEGNDPKLNKEVIVIGAHYDHLGWGGPSSGSLKSDTTAIHRGADDNASGIAGLLELAQYFAAHRNLIKRSVLFAAFSGEELGLLGSNYYVKNPAISLDSTIAMINLDMIGRMRDSIVVIEGMGTSPQWDKIIRTANSSSSLQLKLKPNGFGPSDHASFYIKDVPVMFFFTNLHEDYHRPSDTWDKINYTGEQKILEYIIKIVEDLANRDAKPSFTKVASDTNQANSERQNIRVSLGLMPDYAEDVVGLKISGTRTDSPAEKAGLKSGDVIIKFGGKDIKNIYDYMYMLANYKAGDEVAIVIMRDKEEITVRAILEERKQ